MTEGPKNQLGIPNILTPQKSHPKSSIKDLLHPFWERPCWSQSRTISFPESRKPNKNGTKSVVLSVFVRIVTLSWRIRHDTAYVHVGRKDGLFFRTVPVSFFGNKHQDIHCHFGFYQNRQNRSPYGFSERCSKVFENVCLSESLHSDPCYPKTHLWNPIQLHSTRNSQLRI